MQGSTKRAIAVTAGIATIVAILGFVALHHTNASPAPAPATPQVPPPPTSTTNTTSGSGGGTPPPPHSCDQGLHKDRGHCWGQLDNANAFGRSVAEDRTHGEGHLPW
jgi:hypothetical protein